MSKPTDGRADRVDAPVAAVQDAAIEHALAVGDARRSLALAGALDPLREEAGDDPALTALSTALAAWIGLRERDPGLLAGPTTPPGPGSPSALDGAAGRTGSDGDGGADDGFDSVSAEPAAVGAAVAVERFDVSVARAASLAGCPREAVERARVEREGNDPRDRR